MDFSVFRRPGVDKGRETGKRVVVMSFAFQAVGTKEEVLAQLENTKVENEIGVYVKDALVKGFTTEVTKPYVGASLKYVVEVNGHSGFGAPMSLNCSVRPLYTPSTVVDVKVE